MKRLKEFLFVVLIVLGAGCASSGLQSENIPYPRSTPFDSNELARNAFMDGFRTGYRSEVYKDGTIVDNLPGPHRDARRLGFYAGAGEARREKGSAQEQKVQ